MTDLAAAFSSLASEIENFIANNPGSQNQVSLQQSLTKINNIITHLQVQAINDSLNSLKDSATKLKNVTEKINNTIEEIQRTDAILKQTANLITAIGNLASAIGESNPGKIGQSIESLLTTTGF